jgi:hypothetical protein
MRSRPAGEDGQISLLMIGLVAICLAIVMGVIGATSVQLSRIHVLDAADAAALDASDALAMDLAYSEGVGAGVPLTDRSVLDAAAAHLAQRERPHRLSAWEIAPGTGTPDGRTAVVVVRGTARVPVVSSVLEAFGGGVIVTMTSSARSDLSP